MVLVLITSGGTAKVAGSIPPSYHRHFPPPGGDAYGETQEGSGLEMVKVTITFDCKIVRVTITIRKAANSCN